MNGIFPAQVDFILIRNLPQIHRQDFSFDASSDRKLTWSFGAFPSCSWWKVHFVTSYMKCYIKFKMDDQDRGFRRGRGGRRRERGYRERPSRVRTITYVAGEPTCIYDLTEEGLNMYITFNASKLIFTILSLLSAESLSYVLFQIWFWLKFIFLCLLRIIINYIIFCKRQRKIKLNQNQIWTQI